MVLKVYYIFLYFVKSYSPRFSKKSINFLNIFQKLLHLLIFVCYKCFRDVSSVPTERSPQYFSILQLLFLSYYNIFILKSNLLRGRELMAESFQMMVLPVCKVLMTHFSKRISSCISPFLYHLIPVPMPCECSGSANIPYGA